MDSYPEHAKLDAVADKSQTIGEFLAWLQYETPYRICSEHQDEASGDIRFFPVFETIQDLLAMYFGIDQQALLEEKEAMFSKLKDLNTLSGIARNL